MKFIILLSFVFACQASCMGQNVEKSNRMLQIEKKFDMSMLVVQAENESMFWIFKSELKDVLMGFVIVKVRAGARDSEVEAAKTASIACASFYDAILKKASEMRQSQSPMIYQ